LVHQLPPLQNQTPQIPNTSSEEEEEEEDEEE
jgi:hypothetical protein